MNRFKAWWSTRTKVQKLILCFYLLVFVVLLVWGIIYLFNQYKGKPRQSFDDGNWEKLQIAGRSAPAFVLSPKVERKFGISGNETFVLKAEKVLTEDEINNNLKSTSSFDVKKISDSEFEINVSKNLSPDQVISFSLEDNERPYNWVFQVAPKLKVVSTIPSDRNATTPINSVIEFKFNTDEFKNVDRQIEITPKIDFRTEKHDESLSIIPLKPLNPKTVYQVRLKSPEYGFSFQTSEERLQSPRITLADDFQQVLPDEQLVSKVYPRNWDQNSTARVEVFKFNSSDEFINSKIKVDGDSNTWYTRYGEDDRVDTNGLAKTSQTDLKIQKTNNLDFFQLPFNLSEGFYLLQFWYDNDSKVEQLWVQSTPVLAYISLARDQTSIWLNSTNNEPVNEATIKVLGLDNSYVTNGDGWSSFSTPTNLFDSKKHYIIVSTTNNKIVILPVRDLKDEIKPDQKNKDDYWGYIYHERQIYKPTDSIYFWGVVKDKDTGQVPSTVDIRFGSEENQVKQSVVPNSDGSYMGMIKLDNFPTGWHYLKSFINGVEISSSSVTITEYVKPELKIETYSSKKAIFASEKVDFTAKVTFFDGTAASNIPLSVYEDSAYTPEDSKELSANMEGQVNYTYSPTYDSSNYYPRHEGVTFLPKTSNRGINDESTYVLVYGGKLLIESKGKQENEKASVEATVYNLDLDLINNKGLSDPKSQTASNQKVSVETTKNWSEKKENGTYYDFVEKVTKPRYEYINHQDKIDSKELTTNNEGVVSYELNLEKEKSYNVKLTVTDKDGHQNSTTQYFYYYDSSQNQGVSKAEITMDRNDNSFSLGEEVNLKINKDNLLYKDTDNNKFLYVLANRGKQEIYLRETPEFNFTFEDKYIPNIYVGAIIFNGRYYEEVTSACVQNWTCGGYDYYNRYVFEAINIEYKETDRKLDLKLITNKDTYVPGDKATVTVEVTKDNSPVSDASVQIVLVDEALLAMGKVNEPSLLKDLYKTTASFVYYNYYTHKPVLPEQPQAERGGGGGDRDVFKDTAYFNTATTNAEGKATFEINLPDNITNWLTYAQAITGDVKAGQIESSIIATKDFFVTSHFPPTIVLKDNPYLAVNIFGNSLKENDNVKVGVTFYQNSNEIEKKEVNVKSFKEGFLPFPKLSLGSYQIAVRGKYQDTEDGLILPLNVISSRLDFELSKIQNLSPNDKFKLLQNLNYKSDKPLTLTITDIGRGKYYHTLKGYCYIRSNRVENKLVTILSGQILRDKFENEDCIKNVKDLNVFQASDGGIKQVNWGASDLETTFWATYIDPNQFDKNRLISYFEQNENTLFGSWGLTILGKPKINKIISLSNNATTFEDKVLSALALEYIGQGQLAREKYLDILSEYAYTNKPYIRIQADNAKKTGMDGYLINTAYTLLLSSKVQDEYSEGMDLYLRDYRTEAQDIILEVADISFIKSELNKLPSENTQVTIKSSNRNIERDLSKGNNININLQSNEIDSLSLKVNKGQAEASLNYFVTQEDFDKLSVDKRIKVSRSIKKVKGEGTGFKLGDILAIYLKYDFDSKAPLGCYELTDHVPSGLTVIDNPYNYGLETNNLGHLYESTPNVTKGCAYNSDWWKDYTDNTSVYYVKINSVGKFIHEPSIMQSAIDPSIFSKTSEEFVTVHQ